MRRYASNTVVSVETTQQGIIQLLKRYKAKDYAFGMFGSVAKVTFTFHCGDDVRIMFALFIPPCTDARFQKDAKGKPVHPDRRPRLADQEERRLWRSLLLVIKAKLESVAAGIETVEEAFLAQTVLPNGETLSKLHREFIKPAIAAGRMPRFAGAIEAPAEPTEAADQERR
jgi:hypothetical protein